MTQLRKAFEFIDQFAKRWMEECAIPGIAVGLTSREKLLKVYTHGFADAANRTPVTPETLFEIGSLGKPFTSIALLQLRDAGKLDLHKPVSAYLPWFRVRSKFAPIAVHHLMNHTGGIIRGTERASYGLYDSWALREIEIVASPGQYFCYSSLGYKTLGFVLEELTGQSYGEAIESRILAPLGMTRTAAVTSFETRLRTATGYCGFYDDRPEHPSHPVTPALWEESGTGDGCLASTAQDMAIYLRMLLNRGQGETTRVVSEESFRMMTLDGIWTGGDFYGYGLATYKDEGRTYIGHGGGNAGYRSAIVVDMEAGLGVVLLVNRMGETDPVVAAAQHCLTALRSASRNEPLPPPHRPEHSNSVPDASDYAGVYRSDGRVLRLTPADGKLLMHADAGQVALEPRGADRFYVPDPAYDRFLLEFKRRDGKVVEAFHGSRWYTHERYKGPRKFRYPKHWDAYVGHYRTRNPELSNFRVVLRKGALSLIIPWGTSEPLHPLDRKTFRISDDPLWPERLRFDAVARDRALRVEYSGCPYYRAFTP
ncbi:MAG: serine hydrolase [Gammaproteobacteria bacterium]|nr:serine hydrolase [Gammaproteobacteria bacterium]